MSYANRGKALQILVEHTNNVYKHKGWAVVDEIPIPITITEDNGRYIKGYKKNKSTVDYVGIAHGRGIAFDAKSTQINTSFPLANVHEHQVEYLKKFKDQGGIAFFLIEFEKLKEFYFVPITFFQHYWEAAKEGGRKSIPYKDIQFNCNRIKTERGVALDYLTHCN
ncbi:Holliday junction resolvase RecU [Metabacillus bambusae]|uniref:Holliday junction resolvase RecU n=1 Tax=Metabacillus bambusae TaxID=2795218 RepID=A0ABS3N4I9_9BACI|nr:Holliday junction resolvase RecU [Metabacillus bambusae]MBO1513231.1 Holliday junction resolvase RecU [Metabacillus bambusae]